jgi:hypothetical protein
MIFGVYLLECEPDRESIRDVRTILQLRVLKAMSIQSDGSAEMGREATEIIMNLGRLPWLSFLLYDQR